MSTSSDNSNEIDESLYSRQLYVLGQDAMKKMTESNVLIYGLNGTGVEIAKNVILSGVKAVHLYDTANVSSSDLSSQYYLSEKDIGSNRATVSRDALAELNPYVNVQALSPSDVITSELLSQYKVLVTTDIPVPTQIHFNNMCRELDVKYIHAETCGVFGKIFCDFGKNFVVSDPNGENPTNVAVESIIQPNDTEPTYLVTCVNAHDLESDNIVCFEEIEGLNGLNGVEYKVSVVSPVQFKITVDSNVTGAYTKGGMVKGVKKPITLEFKTLEESISNPDYMVTDWMNIDRPAVLHAAFNALSKFELETKKRPKSHNKEDIDSFVKLATDTFGKEFPEGELNTLKTFASNTNGELISTVSVIGGFAAQEVSKACSGKFTPIKQFLYFDSIGSLQENYVDLDENDFEVESDNRYFGQISVLGKEFQNKILNSSTFIVGAGAIGCELLKNFAMTGVGCGKDGKIYITDMDTIEKSNLNRQFLFRTKDIGSFKSLAASNAIKQMNPNCNITHHENKVCPDTINVYNESFFQSLDFVANALDNVTARRYVDSLCVSNCKPLLESGTLGTKGNTQVIVPHLTESYGSTHDPPEKDIPLCTLKHFPSEINHCIQYARDRFEWYFVNAPKNVNEYLRNPDKVKSMKSQTELAGVYDDIMLLLKDGYVQSFDDCVRFAYKTFLSEYSNQIAQLLNQFPENHTTSEGVPFWTGTKRCPSVIDFSVDNELHMEYILSFSKLWAEMFQIEENHDLEHIKNVIANTSVEKFVPNSKLVLPENDAEAKKKEEEKKENNTTDMDVKDLPDSNLFSGLKLVSLEFEKDDDSNGHISFITAASNLRAHNYKIEPADRHKTKGIAGKIIPAIATTTSIVAGLVTLEMYKLLHNHKKIDQYRCTTLNLALPFMAYMDPIEVPKNKVGDKEFSIWNTLAVKGDKTLAEFKASAEELLGMEVDMIIYNSGLIYSELNFSPEAVKQREAKSKMLMSDIINDMLKTNDSIKEKVLPDVIELSIGVVSDDDDVDAPNIKLYFNEASV